ncbi:MAG: hypothetical protein GKR89_36355 [Candidatus Latescibacteria bacterium]|nr:hypothetical protein [Candidatus Latescibacterota bacterium]
MNQLDIAVVGLRGIGGQHVKNLAQHSRARLAGVADINFQLRTEAAQTHGVQSYDDYRHLLENAQLDAVVLAVPHHLHAPMALEALEAGLHVFVEKPIANRVSEADQMVALAKKRTASWPWATITAPFPAILSFFIDIVPGSFRL